jgi:hypothetical protein
MIITYTILIISLITNIALIFGIRNVLTQNEELEDTLLDTVNDVKIKVNNALTQLRDIDLKGSFESDDEVGGVFTEIKTIVENLNEII